MTRSNIVFHALGMKNALHILQSIHAGHTSFGAVVVDTRLNCVEVDRVLERLSRAGLVDRENFTLTTFGRQMYMVMEGLDARP